MPRRPGSAVYTRIHPSRAAVQPPALGRDSRNKGRERLRKRLVCTHRRRPRGNRESPGDSQRPRHRRGHHRPSRRSGAFTADNRGESRRHRRHIPTPARPHRRKDGRLSGKRGGHRLPSRHSAHASRFPAPQPNNRRAVRRHRAYRIKGQRRRNDDREARGGLWQERVCPSGTHRRHPLVRLQPVARGKDSGARDLPGSSGGSARAREHPEETEQAGRNHKAHILRKRAGSGHRMPDPPACPGPQAAGSQL